MYRIILLTLLSVPCITQAQVTVERGAGLYLGKHAELTIAGDLTSAGDIQGEGTIVMNGSSAQALNMQGNTLSNLRIMNVQQVTLESPVKINRSLELRSGNLVCGRHMLTLLEEAVATGGENAYVQTNGGKIAKRLSQDLSAFLIPVGTTNAYTPLRLSSTGKYSNAVIQIAAISTASPNKPGTSKDYLNNYWTVERTGVEGSVTATAKYAGVTGNEQDIEPFLWNGGKWSGNGHIIDHNAKIIQLAIPAGGGEIFAMRGGAGLSADLSSISLLPNPVNSVATLLIRSVVDEDAVVRVNDSKGTTVMTQTLKLGKGMNQVRLNVLQLADGYYTVTFVSGSQQRALTMVKN